MKFSASWFLFFFLAAVNFSEAQTKTPALESNYYTYVPKADRVELRMKWEPKIVPETAPGIYEFDVRHMNFSNRLVMTIDDAAANEALAKELDVLKKYNIHAVFFIVGSYFITNDGTPLPRSRELLNRIINEGHVIGSHSYIHDRLDLHQYRDNLDLITKDFIKNQETLDRCLGFHYPFKYFRPPNGAHWSPLYTLDKYLYQSQIFLINWNITPGDWCMNFKPDNPEYLTREQIISRTIRQAKEDRGGVILMHGFPKSAEILDDVVKGLLEAKDKAGGFEFVPLQTILDMKYKAGLYH